MTSSHTSARLCHWFSALASALDVRSAPRLALLLLAMVLARGRRTVTSWIRPAGLSPEFRPCYTTVSAAGRRTDGVAARLVHEVVKPILAGMDRLVFGIDDTPTPRLVARLYVRKKDLAGIEPRHRPAFRTKLELAADVMRWAARWLGFLGTPVWVVADRRTPRPRSSSP